MATARKPSTAVLKNVRLSFPKLFKAESSTPTSSPKFSASFLIDPTTADGKANIAEMERVIKVVAKAKWGDKAESKRAALDWDRAPLRDGNKARNDEGVVYAGYEDMMFASASAHPRNDGSRRHRVLRRDKTDIHEDDGSVYGGCYVDAVIDVYAVEGKERGGNGIFASIELVRFRKDGEPFGAGPIDADDYLDDLDDEDDDDLV